MRIKKSHNDLCYGIEARCYGTIKPYHKIFIATSSTPHEFQTPCGIRKIRHVKLRAA